MDRHTLFGDSTCHTKLVDERSGMGILEMPTGWKNEPLNLAFAIHGCLPA